MLALVNDDSELPEKLKQIRALVLRRIRERELPEPSALTVVPVEYRLIVGIIKVNEQTHDMKMSLFEVNLLESETQFVDIEGDFSKVMQPHDFDWIRSLFELKPQHFSKRRPKEYETEEKVV